MLSTLRTLLDKDLSLRPSYKQMAAILRVHNKSLGVSRVLGKHSGPQTSPHKAPAFVPAAHCCASALVVNSTKPGLRVKMMRQIYLLQHHA